MEIRNDAFIVTPIPFTTSLGNNNNLDLKGTMIVVTTSNVNDKITGIIPFKEGHWIEIVNISTNVLQITNNDSNSIAGNRFTTDSGQPILLHQYEFARAFYLSTGGGSFFVHKVGSMGRLIGHLSVYNNADITFGAINTATPINYNAQYSVFGAGTHSTGVNPSRIMATEKCIMHVIINNQVLKGAIGGNEAIYFWFRKNGVDIPNTGYAMQVGANENDVFIVNATFEMLPNDYIESFASVTNTGILLNAIPAAAPVPLIPSVIAQCLLFSPIN